MNFGFSMYFEFIDMVSRAALECKFEEAYDEYDWDSQDYVWEIWIAQRNKCYDKTQTITQLFI